uniref:hypothetical protein n=1 Tax=Pseudomonas aeruginosa TaxID=287 RepID=UPI001C112992
VGEWSGQAEAAEEQGFGVHVGVPLGMERASWLRWVDMWGFLALHSDVSLDPALKALRAFRGIRQSPRLGCSLDLMSVAQLLGQALFAVRGRKRAGSQKAERDVQCSFVIRY